MVFFFFNKNNMKKVNCTGGGGGGGGCSLCISKYEFNLLLGLNFKIKRGLARAPMMVNAYCHWLQSKHCKSKPLFYCRVH